MKFSVKQVGVVLLLLIVVVLFFTSIGASARRYFGVWISEISVALKEDKKLSSETYEWVLRDLDGRDLQFGTCKGKVVFLNFWATWCKPCIEELPDIQELYEAYGQKVIFLLVTQEDSSRVIPFVKRKNLKLPIYYAATPIPEALFSKTVPTTYIIDKRGKIILAETGPSDWNSHEIKTLLDRLIAER